MILLTKPNPASIRRFLNDQQTAAFSYSEVGATNRVPPAGYAINHTRKPLGKGQAVFEAACNALRAWQQLQLGWVDCWPHDAPIVAGTHVAVLGRACGLWWMNACRVVYTIDECQPSPRFGYAHGTLPNHLATGEERFLVEMTADEKVWIDILAFSRPNTALARLGYPLMRRAQRKFGLQSAGRIQAAVASTIYPAGPLTGNPATRSASISKVV